MIARLIGIVAEVSSETVLMDVNGVGYEAHCSLSTLAEMQALLTEKKNLGAKATLWIYTHVREDALTLFGFASRQEKEMFLALLKVNGVGPKMALNVLSGGTVEQVQAMIEHEDVKALAKLPKVGKKTAEQMVLTLKGKLVLTDKSANVPAGASLSSQLSFGHREISSALINLGFRAADVEKVVAQMPKEIELQEGIRQGLSALTSL
jgi:Holliday junction DNA helicase RuvA